MIVKSNLHSSGQILADYTLDTTTNEKVEVIQIHGTLFPNDLKLSLIEMDSFKLRTRARKGLDHIQINPDRTEIMTPKDWIKCLYIALDQKGYKDGPNYRPHAATLHHKREDGRLTVHMHVDVQRYNPLTGKMNSNSWSYRDNDRARSLMERVLGHKPTPKKNANRKIIKQRCTEIWGITRQPGEFMKEAAKFGYVLSKCERTNAFKIVDEFGTSFKLVGKIAGATARDVSRMLKNQTLPTDKEAIKANRMKQDKKQLLAEQIASIHKDARHETEQERKLREAREQIDIITKKRKMKL